MDLLSCWCPYPNSNVTEKKSVSYQAKSLGLRQAAEGDVGFVFMRLKYVKDLCFAFLYHRPVEVSKHLGNLLPHTKQLLERGAEKESETQPAKEKIPRNMGWLHGHMLLGWVYLQQDTEEGWKARC